MGSSNQNNSQERNSLWFVRAFIREPLPQFQTSNEVLVRNILVYPLFPKEKRWNAPPLPCIFSKSGTNQLVLILHPFLSAPSAFHHVFLSACPRGSSDHRRPLDLV